MAEDKHESSVIGFDMLPTEIYHQVGEFLFDNSFSSSSLSAVYFYFFLLSLLNSNMYGRVHSAEFWYYGKIQIVLRNRELFTRQSTKHNSSLERNEQKEEQWETGAVAENSSIDCDPCRSSLYTQQMNYLYEMMHVCHFRSIQFVGWKTRDCAVFIHGLLNKLCTFNPEVLHNLHSLSIRCSIVDLELLGRVLQPCTRLKEFRLSFTVHEHHLLNSCSDSSAFAMQKLNDDSSSPIYPSLELIEYHRVQGHTHQSQFCCDFLVGLCQKSPNVRSLSIHSLPATKHLLSALGKYCKQVESLTFIARDPAYYGSYQKFNYLLTSGVIDKIDNESVLEMINGCPKLSTLTLEHYMMNNMIQLAPLIVNARRHSLKYLRVLIQQERGALASTSISNTDPVGTLVAPHLEAIHFDVSGQIYSLNTPTVSIGDMCGNNCVRSFSASGCNLVVRDHELNLFNRMQSLVFRALMGNLTIKQVVDVCGHLRKLTIQSMITPEDVGAVLTSCPGLIELSFFCQYATSISTILQLQPENLRKLVVSRIGYLGKCDPIDDIFYEHMNLEEFTYHGLEQQCLNLMLEHCPKLRTFQCESTTPSSLDMVFRNCPNLRSVSIPYKSITFPHRMNQLRFLNFNTKILQHPRIVESSAVETMMVLIHCPSIVSVQIANFWNKTETLLEQFINDIEQCHGEDAPAGVACRFVVEKLARSAFERSQDSLSLCEREEAEQRIEQCLVRCCDNYDCTRDASRVQTNISDSGMELHLQHLITLLLLAYEKFQEEKGQLGFLTNEPEE